jgi:hypothetical protein
MPQEVYSTHRGNSSKCPNNKNNTSSNSQLHVKVKSEPPTTNDRPNDTNNQSNDEYIGNNNSTQNSIINNDDEESPTIIDNNDPSYKNSDSDDDSSTYTNAHTFDEYCFKWRIGNKAANPSIQGISLNIMTQSVYLAKKDGYAMQELTLLILLILICPLS